MREAKGLKPPARGVHNDYTHWSARKRLRDLLPAEVDELLGRRFAIVQAWRPIGRAVESDPIAIADARTVGEGDLVPVPRNAPGRIGETWRACYNPRHEFFYYPYMAPDEVLLFKVYDSATDGRARYTPAHGVRITGCASDSGTAAQRRDAVVRVLLTVCPANRPARGQVSNPPSTSAMDPPRKPCLTAA